MARRFFIGLLLVCLAAIGTPLQASAANPGSMQPSTAGFSYFRTGLAPLINSHTMILQGTKLASGACRYTILDAQMTVPPGGWEERTIALDPTRCRKLIESGTPTSLDPPTGEAGTSAVAQPAASAESGGLTPLTMTATSAYIRIFWMDVANLKVNQDVTQINWSYNGSTVSGAWTTGYWNWLTLTGWSQYAKTVSGSYGPGSTYYFGQTTSDYVNSWFCAPLPTVYTHYYYVRMWGQYNGTAQWSQSSDSIDECLPFHWDKITAYGNFPGF